ncbi:MAG: EamA family transporter [Nitrososphaeraceae archaeon]
MPTALLIRKSWIVFVYAAAISIESIIIEFLTTSYIQISPILLSSTSITLAGILLLLAAAFIFRKRIRIIAHFGESWRFLIPASLSLAIGIFTWYDSINRIGASKESLIAGPLEIVVIVLLARLFLRERLHKTHIVGMSLALIGFILALLSDADFSTNGSVRFVRTTAMSALGPIGFGDAEAMISALGFAIGVLFLSKLVSRYSSIEVAGASMFLSGIFLCTILLFGILIYDSTSVALISSPTDSSQIHLPLTYTIVILFLFSLIPFVGSLSYSTGLSRIGASLTATIGSSSILITVILQLMIRQLGIVTHLPVNIILAILGGVVGFCGIYIIHMPKYSVPITNRN